MKNQSSVKCVRDLRDIPPTAYKLDTDGRQQRHLCEQRQRLMWLLASYANGDGTRAFPSVKTLANSLGLSRRTVLYRLDDLKALRFIENAGYHGESGPRVRTINIAAIQATGVQPSMSGVQSSPEQECNLGATGVQSTKAGVHSSGSGAQSSIAHNRPSDRPKEQTDRPDRPASQTDPQNGKQAGSSSVGSVSSSTKTSWQQFIQKAQDAGLCNEMVYATPKPEEVEAVLARLHLWHDDISDFVDEIGDWVEMQSPPLATLQYGRWTRWLEQTAPRFAELASRRKPLTAASKAGV